MQTHGTTLTPEEKSTFFATLLRLYRNEHTRPTREAARAAATLLDRLAHDHPERTTDAFGFNRVVKALQAIELAHEEIGLRGQVFTAYLMRTLVRTEQDCRNAELQLGREVGETLRRFLKVEAIEVKTEAMRTDNFRNLLISQAGDMRVVLMLIADSVMVMRSIRDVENDAERRRLATEAAYLYAPLAHKLGLYKLKSELEDLSLKYLEHDAYYMIKDNLNATKRSRDAYIERFTAPIRQMLDAEGLRYHMKGRTKSIHSIWQKMKKQQCGFHGVYDLFAIRIILDSPRDKEYMQCWQVFALITAMYQPNPKRMRDWLSVPKSNGYESLHTTVLGPENKWVEVQIRTERMDEIAEHGLAAHWRYKGIKSEKGGIDEWLANIRSALENNDDLQLMDQFKMDLKEDEVYVFTPKGDLLNFPKGATVLDFAYYIHSRIGNTCVGGKINGRAVSFRQELHSGDQIEILTQSNQKPRQEWINIVKTSKAKAKIRLAIKETQKKEGLFAKELLERRFKNRKLEIEESIMARTIKKMGYKENSDFYKDIAEEKIDPNSIIEKYIAERDHDLNVTNTTRPAASAAEFEYENPTEEMMRQNDDVLVIDENLKGIDFELAHCCHPIYGDPIFGFVTVSKGIKVHRSDCPNAKELQRRFGYRIVKAKWSGKGTSKYAITLRIIGNDDIGIVSNITNIISKEDKLVMRGINISSKDGLFSGNITVMIDDASRTEALIKKLSAVKGVKQVMRI